MFAIIAGGTVLYKRRKSTKRKQEKLNGASKNRLSDEIRKPELSAESYRREADGESVTRRHHELSSRHIRAELWQMLTKLPVEEQIHDMGDRN